VSDLLQKECDRLAKEWKMPVLLLMALGPENSGYCLSVHSTIDQKRALIEIASKLLDLGAELESQANDHNQHKQTLEQHPTG
jgi:hypothetical protein